MNIAVNTRFWHPGNLEGYGYFIQEVLYQWAKSHPEHRYYCLFDRPHDPDIVFSENMIPVVAGPAARHPLLWKYWYDVKIPMVLKKIKADVFVSPDGFASLTTKVPQCMVVHDLGFLHYPETYRSSHRRYYRHYMPAFLKKAAVVATVSQFSKDDLVKQYHMPAEKINVVYSAAREAFSPLSPVEKEAVRTAFADGKEYFIYVGAVQPRKNLINLLKGFSLFKKRQKTNMKLVIAGRTWKGYDFKEQLKAYKYRDDVILMDYVPEETLVSLVAAAYALVYPSFFEGFGVPPLEAIRSGVPPLTSRGTAMEEICKSAALYFDPTNPDDIGDKLMLIYKDETLRNKLIENGKAVGLQYSWKQTAELLWEAVLSSKF